MFNKILLGGWAVTVLLLVGSIFVWQHRVDNLKVQLSDAVRRATVAEMNMVVQGESIKKQNKALLDLMEYANRKVKEAEGRVKVVTVEVQKEREQSDNIPGTGPETMNPWMRESLLDR